MKSQYILSIFFALVAGFAVAMLNGATDYIDVSVSPQQDFYQHVNGAWKSIRKGDGTQAEIRQYISNRTDDCLRNILTPEHDIDSKEADYDGQIGDDMKGPITKLYRSLIKNDSNKFKSSIRSEFILIDKITEKTKEIDIPIVLGHLNSIGVPAFVDFKIKLLNSYGQVMRVAFIYPNANLPSPIDRNYIKYLFKNSGVPIVDKTNIITIDDKAADKILALQAKEQEVARAFREKYRVPFSKSIDISKFQPYTTPQKMGPWDNYLQTSELSNKEQFVRYDQSYFTSLNTEIFMNPLFSVDDLKTYLKFQFLNHYIATPPPKTGAQTKLSPQERIVRASFSHELPRLCFEGYIAANADKINKIAFNVAFSYLTNIPKIPWMTENTKDNAENMLLEGVTVEYALPTKLELQLKDSDLSDNDPIANLKFINSYHYNQLRINLLGPIKNYATADSIFTGDDLPLSAYYNPASHRVVLPLSYLVPPFFQTTDDPLQDNALNYSGIGYVIGHELAHALEIVRLSNDPLEIQRFNNISDALKAQYELYNRGTSTINEDIADILGLRMTAQAYKRLPKRAPAPMFTFNLPNDQGKLNLSGTQLFYYNFAAAWRRSNIPNHEAIHSLGKDRVNASLKYDEMYNETFKPQPWDKMSLHPDKPIPIW